LRAAGSGSINSGGGGGGMFSSFGTTPSCQVNLNQPSGAGGSGVAIFVYAGPQTATGGTVTSNGTHTFHTFTSSGSFAIPSATYGYGVTANTTSINEGQTVRYHVYSNNLSTTTLYYSLTGVIAEDITGGNLSGSFSLVSGNANVEVNLAADANTDGTDNLIFTLRDTSISGNILANANVVIVSDTSLTPPPIPTYSISIDGPFLDEGQATVFSVTTTNVNTGTTLYWTNAGNTNASDFVENVNSGSFVINNNAGNVTLTLASDLTTEGPETIIFQLRTDSTSGNIVATANTINAQDTSTTPPPIVEYLIVAGGGGGGARAYSTVSGTSFGGGGGGAGGLINGSSGSPLAAATTYTIIVGSGGAGAQFLGVNNAGTTYAASGSPSCFGAFGTAVGGGGGGSNCGEGTPGCKTCSAGDSGGSGGGGGRSGTAENWGPGGSGTPGQGNPGGNWGISGCANNSGGAGGGGAGAPGDSGLASACGKPGGIGVLWGGTYYAGGGGGGGQLGAGSGGSGGGGPGASGLLGATATPGSDNTGGGGGGAGSGCNTSSPFHCLPAGSGGSGIVIIKYAGAQAATGGTVVSGGGYTCHVFTSSGSFITN
jgi:hypothetical protein